MGRGGTPHGRHRPRRCSCRSCRFRLDTIRGSAAYGRDVGGGNLRELDSEEVDTVKTLAAQAATAIMNGRLFRSLHEKAEELRGLKEPDLKLFGSL